MSEVETSGTASRGKYTCICEEGYYVPNETLQGFTSAQVESGGNNFSCIPCPRACSCDSAGQCLFQEDPDGFSTETLLKAAIGVVLGTCMCCCVVLAIIVFRQRKCKVSSLTCPSDQTFHFVKLECFNSITRIVTLLLYCCGKHNCCWVWKTKGKTFNQLHYKSFKTYFYYTLDVISFFL